MNNRLKNVKDLLVRKNTDLLLFGGVTCIFGGGILAVRQTPKAVRIMDKNKEAKTMTKVKKVAPLYIPSVLLAGVGVAQIICSRNITNNKIAAITTAYTVSDTAFRTYKSKVKDIVDPEKVEKINNEVASDILRNDPVSNKEVIISDRGDTLIYDPMSGRYFMGSSNEVGRVVNMLNKRMMSEMEIQLNDLYIELNIPIIKIGCELGWRIDKEAIEMNISSSIAEDGRPCLVLEYDVIPLRRY